MVTGANSGIGKRIAAAVAKRGGTIHMVCRNENLAETAKNELIAETQNKVGTFLTFFRSFVAVVEKCL